jgi:hypothetical protein
MADTIDDILKIEPPPLVNQLILRGLIKSGDTEDHFSFSPGGCEEWITLRKADVLHTRLIRHTPCLKRGEEPHSHPIVEITFNKNSEMAAVVAVIARLQRSVLHTSSLLRQQRRNPLSGTGSCGQFCDDIDQGHFDCGDGARPVSDDDGHCYCDPDDCP